MPTRNVVLTDRQEALIGSLLASGRYQSASEALREGLRLLEQREAEDVTRLGSLREAASIGVAAIERGAFQEVADREALVTYLNGLAERGSPAAPDP